ncbi:MAG TPA: ATP-binding protein [Thermoanaerobaculia bacterium]|nr:ATP-binding protein [Thermoanaerobaculia bacterium]
MKHKSLFLNLLMALATLAVIVGAFQAFQRKRDSFERLDFEYQWDRGTIVVTAVEPDSGAAESGLRAGDRVWLVGGTPPGEIDGLRRSLRQMQTAPLLVVRGEEMLTLAYTAPALEIDYHYLFLTFIGFLYLAIGLFTFVRGAGRESALFYLVTLLAFIVFVYTPAGKTNTTFKILWIVEEIARIFLPPLTLHFFLRFPRPLIRQTRTLAAIYAVPVLLTLWVANLFALNNAIALAPVELSFLILDRLEMLQFAVYFSLALVALTWTFRTAAAAGQKKQIQWIYLGMAVGFIPFLILYLIPFISRGSGSAYTTIAILPLALIPLAFAVSILKYKLWDVEVVIKEVLAYTVTFGFGMIAFSTVNVLLSHLIEERLALERNFLAFASGLLIAGVLVPMKGRIETLIEMVLYRDTWRHRKAISSFAEEIATFHDLGELIEIIRDRLSAAVRIQRMNLYIREGTSLTCYTEERQLPDQIAEAEVDHLPAGKPLILDRPRLPEETELPVHFLGAGYRYLFALRHRGELQGLLLCGNKRGDEPLSTDDLQLVSSLTPPLALAIENARLYGRLRTQLDQIRSLKEYNENIIESSSSAIAVVGPDGMILTANQAFWDLVGTEPGAADPVEKLFPPYRDLRTSPRGMLEVSFVNSRGAEKRVTATSSPFRAADAPVGASVLVVGDVSEIARLERELQEKDRLASLGLLAAGVAHEVNTPLTGISSYAQLLLADVSPDDPKYAILKKIEQQTFRASRLVNNLLDFAANRSKIMGRVHLGELIRSTVSIHEDLLRARGIQVHIDPLPELQIDGDFFELQQVLTNLLLNARDAVEPGGNIWFGLRVEQAEAILTVRDDGRGIPSELQRRIFEPLVTTKQGQGGTGLGLAISERIVHSVGGEIRVESQPGEGATFSVILPLNGPAHLNEPTGESEAPLRS